MFIAHKFTREIFIYLIFIILVYFLGIIQIENVFDTRNYILNFMGSDTPEGSETGKDSEIKDEDKGSKDGMTINISKEAMMEAAKILGDSISQILPVVGSTFAGGKIGVAMIKNSQGLPPLVKGVLGVGTAIGTAGGMSLVGKTLGSQKINEEFKNEASKIIALRATNTKIESDVLNSNIETIVDESSKILSILEGEMSPLFYLLSYNLILGLLILLHIIIILIILGYKYEYIPVRKVFSYIINRILMASKKEYLLKKFEVIRNKIEIFGGIYLNVLLKINVISIILDVLLIIYINYDLLANLDNYVIVHNYLNNLN